MSHRNFPGNNGNLSDIKIADSVFQKFRYPEIIGSGGNLRRVLLSEKNRSPEKKLHRISEVQSGGMILLGVFAAGF